MRAHRFIGDFVFGGGVVAITDRGICTQISRVLRLRAGDEIILADGRLNEVRVRLAAVSSSRIEGEILERFQNLVEPARFVGLYCSIIKRENFEWVAQKATEAGVSMITPVIAERTVKLSLKEDRLRTIIREAAEQSGRGIVPELAESIAFDEALRLSENHDAKIFFDGTGLPFTPLSVAVKSAAVFIGPEGGWAEREIEVARKAGCYVATLGATTLRTETAAVVATYLTTR